MRGVSVLNKGNLRKAIAAAMLVGTTSFVLNVDLPQAEAAQKYKSLYEEYQAAQQAEMDAIAKENKKIVDITTPIDEAAQGTSNGDGPSDFLNRIRSIINASHTSSSKGDYSRFLNKPSNAPRNLESNGGEVVSVYKAETHNDDVSNTYVDAPPPEVVEGTYNFNWQGTPIAQSLYALGSIAHKGVIVNGNLTDKVYARLDNVTVKEALDFLSRAFNFNWMMEGNNIIVSSDDKMLQSMVFNVSYADKEKLKEEFKSMGIDDSKIYVNSESGTVSITATPYQIAEAKKRIKQIDRPVSQCLLAAQLIEINHGKNLNLGLTYTMPSYSHTGTETGGENTLTGKWLPKFSFGATLQAERALSKGKVISRPIVLSRNGEKAKIMFGDKVPVMSTTSTSTSTNVTVTYQDIGTALEVTPVINTETQDISLKINAEVSNISGYVTQGSTRAPQVNTRTINTTTHVKSGQSLVIGGLMSVTDLDNLSGIPGLMNLPILGELFKFHHRSKTYAEVYIMLTPFIMDSSLDVKEITRKVEY